MEGKDNIKDLFSQKLGNYEATVNPELWAKISSQVAAAGATTAVGTGLSLFAKIAIGIGISAATITSIIVFSPDDATNQTAELPKVEVTEQSEKAPARANEIIENDQESKAEVINPSDSRITLQTTPQSPLVRQETQTRPVFDPIGNLDRRIVEQVPTSTKEPRIIEGITSLDVTRYGSGLEKTPEENKDIVKRQPIEKFPNVFTPNGDKENDNFFLISEGLVEFSVVVLNTKGEVVYQSSDPKFSWNGLDMRTGELVPEGNYMYMVSAYDADRNPYPIYERLEIKY